MPKKYYYLFIVSLILFISQLLAGTQIETATLFSIAIFFGLCAVFATGSWNSLLGLLNLALVFRFLLFGVILKTIFLQPSDVPLRAPVQTGIVAALGFAGVLLGTLIHRNLPKVKSQLIYTIYNKNFYLVLYVFLLIVGYGAWLYIYLIRNDSLDPMSSRGGVFGILEQFGELKALSISAAIYYVWLSKSKRFLSHPLVLFALTLSILVGIFSTSKQGMIDPLVYFFLTTLSLKGVSYKPLWIILITSSLIYLNIIYPFSQYIRYAGGREGTVSERVTLMSDVLSNMATDEEYRNNLNTTITKYNPKHIETYLPVGSDSLSRFALIAEADRLVAASTNSEQTGWETITWGFRMILPRFINPDKPMLAANNFLAHLVGDLNSKDYTTQISYGFMANFYNAFGFSGVIIGSTILISALFYWLTLFFGNPNNLSLWVILVFGAYNHSLVEKSVADITASIWFPVITLVTFLISKNLNKIIS